MDPRGCNPPEYRDEGNPPRREEFFSRLGFADSKKALSLWTSIAPRDDSPDIYKQRAENLLEALASSPDPDMALLNLVHFIERTITPGAFFGSVFLERPIMDLALTIFSCSQFLADILSRNPEYLSWLIEDLTLSSPKPHSQYALELRAQTRAFRDPRRRLNSVKRYYRREMLRIGARDLLGIAAVEEVTAELSFLADAILEKLYELAFEELSPAAIEAGVPNVEEEIPFHGFAIISLGKLGGTELNYSSDIDLIFVCADSEDRVERAFYSNLARRMVELLSEPTEEGSLYRVDLRLRPDGDSGPLVVSIEEHLNYLQRRARPWELQALTKARRSAGNRRVAETFLKNCERAIFGSVYSGDPLSEILTLRERSIAGLRSDERAANVKLMPGGIRDIEFIAQAMQLVHGKNRPEVRSRNTLEALERLAHYGLLGHEVKETLERTYRLLRTVEHRLQMMHYARVHTLPIDERELELLSKRVACSALGWLEAENFRSQLARLVTQVQHIFRDFFRDISPGTVPLILSLPPGDSTVNELLARFGVFEGEQAHRALSSLVFGDFPDLESSDTFCAAVSSLPSILARASETPDPSITIRNLVKIVKATRAVKATLTLLSSEGDFARMLLAVAAHSSKLSDLLAGRMDLLDRLAEGISPGDPPRIESLDEGSIALVGRWYEEALLHIHLSHPLPGGGPEHIGQAISDAAGKALVALLKLIAVARTDLAIFAAGSLGSRRMHFGSDVDLLAVTDCGENIEEEYRIIRSLISVAQAARLPKLDLRLRGEGESAPLVQTIDAYERYFETRAEIWEILALSKCRFLWGSRKSALAFEEVLKRAIGTVRKSGDWISRIRDAREKLENLSKGLWDVKHAAGGTYDIDFIVSTAFLSGLIDFPGSDPEGAFEYLASIGLLEDGESRVLCEAHRLFWKMEHAASLNEIPFPPAVEREEYFERYFSRLFESSPGGERFLAYLARTKLSVRSIFDRFFERIERV